MISAEVVTKGWGTALLGAVTTAVVLLVIAEVTSLLFYVAGTEPRPSVFNYVRLGGLIFSFFHHVGVKFDVSSGTSTEFAIPFAGGFTVALAALLATFVGLWLLARTGRKLGEEAGGSSWARAIHGAKVAVPYAVITLVLAILSRIPENALDPAGSPPIHPSYLAAFFWPLGLAAVAGFAGGFRSAGEERWSGRAWSNTLRGAFAGGAWMIAVAMVLAFIGLVLLAPVHPGATSEYFSTFDDKFSQGLALVMATALVSPNLAAGLILFPAMGTCLAVAGSAVGVGGSFCVLSWTQFPSGGISAQSGLDLPSPPAGYLLYLLVPLIAVLVGGMMAVRRGKATTQEQAVTMGLLAGVVFGLLSLLLAFLVTITFRAQGGDLGGFVRGRIGPELFPGALWPFLWGVVGGAIGAFIAGRRLPRAMRAAAPSTPDTDPAA